MNSPLEKRSGHDGEAGQCLARSVVDTLAEEPALEAVTIDRAQQKISVATLGRTDVGPADRTHHGQISGGPGRRPRPCVLVAERPGRLPFLRPRRCPKPSNRRITIQNNGPTTTIARMTCPTAPKFWRWRDIPFPKVVQRDVEFLESAEHIDEHINEWKSQLAAAMLCGVLGLAARFLLAGQWSVAAYVCAYLAGGFYPAVEVWERLQKRTIDVHFLMIFVAAGAASIGAWGEGATLLFLFSFSGALEHYALGRTQKEIRSLFRDAPKVATALDDRGQ